MKFIEHNDRIECRGNDTAELYNSCDWLQADIPRDSNVHGEPLAIADKMHLDAALDECSPRRFLDW